MNTRRQILAALSLSMLSAALPSLAQQPAKVAKIGFLASFSSGQLASRLPAFQQGLRALGYVEGKNIFIAYRYADGKLERLPDLAAELVSLDVDILFVQGSPAALAAKNATKIIPIVIGNASDPVGIGLIASLARPGGNITGMSDFNVEVVTKRFELLKEVVPSASRIAVLSNPANSTNPIQLQQIRTVASALGVTLLSLEARTPDDIDHAFAVIKPAKALLVFGDPMLGTHQRQIIELAARGRLPAIYADEQAVDAGGLMSYAVNFGDLYRRAAVYIDKILKGAKPGDLPVEQPTTFQLAINMKTAKALGIKFPQSILLRADKVIE